MSDQLSTNEARTYLLSQIDAGKQIIESLSEEDLEKVVGGISWKSFGGGLAAGLFAPGLLGGLMGGGQQQAAPAK
jgi:hypothetical protein